MITRGSNLISLSSLTYVRAWAIENMNMFMHGKSKEKLNLVDMYGSSSNKSHRYYINEERCNCFPRLDMPWLGNLCAVPLVIYPSSTARSFARRGGDLDL